MEVECERTGKVCVALFFFFMFSIENFRVYLGVRSCEVCFVTIIFLGSIVLPSLFSLFCVTCERNRLLHRG